MSELEVLSKVRKSKTEIPKWVSLEDYFRLEEKSLHKNEYHDGIIIQMAGAKLRHNRLASKAIFQLEYHALLKNLTYIVSNSDTKIRIEAFNKVVYPDALVICETPQYYKGREDTITNPSVVVEVLSGSTQKFDRTTKFEMYRTLPSFKEYVLIYQDRQHVTVWTKQEGGAWLPKDYMGLETTAVLHTLEDCPMPLAQLYKAV